MSPGGRHQGNTVPANYKGLPVDANHSRVASALGHDKYLAKRFSGRLELQAEVLGAVHMGTGAVDLHEEQNRLYLDIVSTAKGRDCLPGTGIKGPIRSLFEALSSSCPLERGCAPGNNMCPACSLFGSLGYMGRVGFEEFIDDPKDPAAFGLTTLPTAYPPRLNKGRRVYGQPHEDAEKTANTSYGVLAPHSKLNGALVFENASEDELGLLFLSMGMDGSFTPRFGGGKHGGIGAVRFSAQSLTKMDPKSRYGTGQKSKALQGDELSSWVSALCDKANSQLGEKPKQALAVMRNTMDKDGW